MRKSKLRDALFSVFAGVFLALAVMFTANIFTTKVRADEGGYWKCPLPAPAGYGFDGCFQNGMGENKCRYSAIENGANCSTSPTCEWVPLLE